jgi:hypothetical protein
MKKKNMNKTLSNYENNIKTIYYEIYNDIVNYRVLSNSQTAEYEKLNPKLLILLLNTYNDVIKSLQEANML